MWYWPPGRRASRRESDLLVCLLNMEAYKWLQRGWFTTVLLQRIRLAAYDQQQPDVVLLNIEMPEMDDYTTCRELHLLETATRIRVEYPGLNARLPTTENTT